MEVDMGFEGDISQGGDRELIPHKIEMITDASDYPIIFHSLEMSTADAKWEAIPGYSEKRISYDSVDTVESTYGVTAEIGISESAVFERSNTFLDQQGVIDANRHLENMLLFEQDERRKRSRSSPTYKRPYYALFGMILILSVLIFASLKPSTCRNLLDKIKGIVDAGKVPPVVPGIIKPDFIKPASALNDDRMLKKLGILEGKHELTNTLERKMKALSHIGTMRAKLLPVFSGDKKSDTYMSQIAEREFDVYDQGSRPGSQWYLLVDTKTGETYSQQVFHNHINDYYAKEGYYSEYRVLAEAGEPEIEVSRRTGCYMMLYESDQIPTNSIINDTNVSASREFGADDAQKNRPTSFIYEASWNINPKASANISTKARKYIARQTVLAAKEIFGNTTLGKAKYITSLILTEKGEIRLTLDTSDASSTTDKEKPLCEFKEEFQLDIYSMGSLLKQIIPKIDQVPSEERVSIIRWTELIEECLSNSEDRIKKISDLTNKFSDILYGQSP